MSGATGFDRAAFDSALDEVGARLGDLWAVDAFLADRADPAQGEAGPFGRSPLAQITVRVGAHHPFETWLIPPDATDSLVGRQAAAQAIVDDRAAEGAAWGADVARSLRARVEEIVRPEPSAFSDAVHTMTTDVLLPIQTEIGDNFAHLASLSDWEGAAADQFNDYFYSQIGGVRARQMATADAICFGIAGAKAAVDLGQQSLMNLVCAANDALDRQLVERASTHAITGTTTSTWLMVAATVFGLVAAIPTGGASAGVAAGVGTALSGATSQFLQLSASEAGNSDHERTLEVVDAEQTVQDLTDSICELQILLELRWATLAAQTSDLIAAASPTGSTGDLRPRRPNVVHAPVRPLGWHHESAPR